MTFTALRAFGLPAALFALVLGAGCASTPTDDSGKLAQDAMNRADEANRAALDAVALARSAKEEAAAARAAAEAARRAAEEARAAAMQTNEKIDRAFKKSVQK